MFSKEYIEQLKVVHFDKSRAKGFGGKIKSLGRFKFFMSEWNVDSLLDYGCGKGYILSHLKEKYPHVTCHGYDPAIEMFSSIPTEKVACVFSNDVLEHIEPDHINNVLQHIDSLALKYIWLRIDTKPARKILPDGRNAHLILESPEWWMIKINENINGSIVFNELNNKGKFDVAIEK